MRNLTVKIRKEEFARLSDAQLMQLASGSNEGAFEELYNRYARRVGGFFLRMLGYNRTLAEDFTQELFCRLYAHRSNYQPQQPFATWLFAMAYNLCKNEYRHAAVKEAYRDYRAQTFDEAVPPTEQMDEAFLKQKLSEAVQTLPAVQREVFLLRYEEELPVAEVAQIVGCPEGTVKSRLFTALATVTDRLKKYQL